VPRSAGLVARVVLVPGGAGAADARRRVADVLLRAALARTEPPAVAEPASTPTPPPTPTPTPTLTPDPTPTASSPPGGEAP